MKTNLKVNVEGLRDNNDYETSYPGTETSIKRGNNFTIENITFDMNLEYTPAELFEILKTNAAIIKEIPSIITACVQAYKDAMVASVIPATSEPEPSEK